jgi:hypothetical protein
MSQTDSDVLFSDDEQQDASLGVTWATSKGAQLPFGKYKGYTLGSMITTGKRRHYLRYLQKWDELLPSTRAVIDESLKEYERLKEEAAASKEPPKKKKKK